MPQPELSEPLNVLYRIKRGLVGYISYLAACQMDTALSEYTLYEPILRILTARGYRAACEVAAPGMPRTGSGDLKRIDFEATKEGSKFALEVKWARRRVIRVAGDIEKLAAYREANQTAHAFLCVFGKESVINDVAPTACDEVGRKVVADLGITKFACRIFAPRPNRSLATAKP